MFKSIVIVTLLLTGVIAQNQDMNLTVQKYIDEIETDGVKNGGWVITQKKRSPIGESFIATLTPSKTDDNQTYEGYPELVGLSFVNDINYTTTSLSSVSTLTEFPTKDLDENETLVVKSILDKKLIVLRGDYSLEDYLYSLKLDDINSSVDDVNITTKDIKLSGYYDYNSTQKEINGLSIDTLEILPTDKEFFGDYFRVKNMFMEFSTQTQDDTITVSYKTSVELLDSNLSGEHSKAVDANLDIQIINMDEESYRTFEKLSGENPQEITSKELETLGSNLLTSKDLAIEINDLSIASLINQGTDMGSAKIDAKISLDIDPKNKKLITLNPLMALSYLKVDASIELSKEIVALLTKDPRAMMLAFLPPKEKDGNMVYEILFNNNKLTINGQNFLQ